MRCLRLRNVIMSLAACAFFAGPALLFGAQKLDVVSVPDWLSTKDASYLSGGVVQADVLASATLEGFMNEDLQEALESEISNSIPMKASALLCNAAVQRFAIASSSAMFSWPIYPTYYGSSRLLDPVATALSRFPMHESDDLVKSVQKFARGVDAVASRYPDKRFCIVIADQSDFSNANPAFDLMDDLVDSQRLEALMREELDLGGGTVDTVLVAYDDAAKYYDDFYRTDHHWNGYGALEAYNAIPESYGFQVIQDPRPLEGISDILMNGSNARSGLDLLNQPAQEPVFDLGGISIASDVVPPVLDRDGVQRLQNEMLRAEFNFYETWYGGWSDAILENEAPAVAGNALIVCDSFGTAFRYLVAKNCEKTYVDYDLHADKEELFATLEDRIRESDCDVVFFVARPGNYIDFLNRWPGYFE